MEKLKALFAGARARRPMLDHAVRAYQRYQAEAGDQMAAAVTFYWFLSLFPLLLVAMSVTGYLLGGDATATVSRALSGYLPDQLIRTIDTTLTTAKGKAGLIGAAGLLLSGLGWVDSLRQSLRTMWHHNVQAGNIVTQKVADVVVLVGLFATISASVVVTAATTAATGTVVSFLGLSHTTTASVFTQVLTYLLAWLGDTVLFVFVLTRLPRLHCPLRRVLGGAVGGALGFQVLKFAGALYVAHTTSKGQATYGTFAVVVGLLLFLNLVSRYLLLTAAFVVTAPYDSDVAPSGTASAALAREAGVPPDYLDTTSLHDGAPTGLGPALRGSAPATATRAGRGARRSDAAGG